MSGPRDTSRAQEKISKTEICGSSEGLRSREELSVRQNEPRKLGLTGATKHYFVLKSLEHRTAPVPYNTSSGA